MCRIFFFQVYSGFKIFVNIYSGGHLFISLFTYLVELGLSCRTRDSLVTACELLVEACGLQFSDTGVQCLMGQPLCCSAANAGVWAERGYGDASTPHA